MLPFSRKIIQRCVNASQHVRLNNALIRKANYTVIIATVYATKNKKHVLQNCHRFVSKLQIILSNT